jgi:hypothetical protein
MKSSFVRSTALFSLFAIKIADAACTNGKLYFSDLNSTYLYVANLDDGLDNITATKLDLELKGSPPLYLELAAASLVVTAAYWGSEEVFMTDGVVNLVHTGLSLVDHGDHLDMVEGEPYLIVNADISCGAAYHPVSHNGIFMIGCDGSMEAEPPINTTVMAFDESNFSADPDAESAVITTFTLDGSHHGVNIPVDDGHILHSIATEDLINRVGNTSSLPNTFQVVDYEGNLLHELTDLSDPDESCFGFHGLAHFESSYYFACSHDLEEHGGMLVVEYDDTTETYSSRHLLYPNANLSNHRSGTIVGHQSSSYLIADFADWEAEVYAPQLMALEEGSTEITPENVLNLGVRGQCDYGLEQSEGKLVVVMLPSGMVQVYSPLPTWTLLAEKKVLEPTDECPWPAPFRVGYMSAFLFSGETLYSLDLSHVEDDGKIDLYSTTLDFFPYHMNVAAVPEGMACAGHSGGEEEHTDEDTTEEQTEVQEITEAPAATPSSDAHFDGTFALVSLAVVLLATANEIGMMIFT